MKKEAEQPSLPKEQDAGKVATSLLMRWLDRCDQKHPAYRDTMAFLGLPNSVGWIWANEVRFERDFEADLLRHSKIIMECLRQAEETAAELRAENEALRAAATPAPSGRDPATIEASVAAIETMKESGHCGESTSEMIARQRRSATLEAAQKAIRALTPGERG